MLKSKKSQLTCSYCSKIFKDPVELPCEDSICRQHLIERSVVKENKLKCKQCNEEFLVKDIEFKSSKAYNKLIESHSHLSDEETNLKQQLEVSIRKFFESSKTNSNKINLYSNRTYLIISKRCAFK
jgi:hypothetical protein